MKGSDPIATPYGFLNAPLPLPLHTPVVLWVPLVPKLFAHVQADPSQVNSTMLLLS